MRTNEKNKGLRLAQSALPEMRARLALLDDAISALQCYEAQFDVTKVKERTKDDVDDLISAANVRFRPFLVARRDDARAEKAS